MADPVALSDKEGLGSLVRRVWLRRPINGPYSSPK